MHNIPNTRFSIISFEDQFDRLLPKEMKDYANTHFPTFLPEKGIHGIIAFENLVPFNIDKLHTYTIDDFVEPLMSKNKAASNQFFENVQQKNNSNDGRWLLNGSRTTLKESCR